MEERVTPRRQEPQRPTTADTDPALSSGDDDSTDGEQEFEFPCFLGGDLATPALADDLFADGRIRPAAFYPVFGRRPAGAVDGAGLAAPEAPAPEERRTRGRLGRLFLEESRAWNSSTSSSSSTDSSTSTSSSSAAADDLEGAAPGSYCVWTPGASAAASSSPRPPRPSKSGSTGSMARWRRVSDLVVGRSHSDGKEKFLFLPANPPPPPIKKNPATKQSNTAAGAKKKAATGTEINTVGAAQRMALYGAANKAVGAGGGAPPRRTFLPYREELVGFFANVHGISRSHPHPY